MNKIKELIETTPKFRAHLTSVNQELMRLDHENRRLKILLWRKIKQHGDEIDAVPLNEGDAEKIENSIFTLNSNNQILVLENK